MIFSIHKAPLRTKYFIWTTLIIIGFCLASSTLYYFQMKKSVMRDALKQSEIILYEVESIQDYVRNVIRPTAYELTSDDDFILELMSTTYVSLQITSTFQEKMKGYTYRRVSLNPRNPKNRADTHEEKMAEWFESDRSRTFWQGMVEKENGTFFVSMIPDFITKDCLYCHGKPEDAPPKIIERYGNHNGFRFEEGDLAGVNSVSIPISDPLSRLYTMTVVMFVLILGASFCLLIVLNLLFNQLVVSRLFKVIEVIGENDAEIKGAGEVYTPRSDELDTLKESFRHLSSYVRTAQKGSKQMPNFIGPYIIQQPLAAGTLSWLYSGIHAETKDSVTLKIPFENISENPIYRACYRNEIKVMRSSNHPSLLKITDTIENVLITPSLSDYSMFSTAWRKNEFDYRLFYTNLFKLVAYLHTHGIVHQDLRPDNFCISPASTPLLIDAGLAWWHKTPDDLFSTGLGPQGNPAFMPPEQLEGMRGDSRSDIYSLGVWLYNHMTGETLFQDISGRMSDLLKAKNSLTSPGKISADLHTDLAKILLKAMEPNPEKRYQWVEDFRDDILPHISAEHSKPKPPASGKGGE